MRWAGYGLMFLMGVLIGQGLTGTRKSNESHGAADSHAERQNGQPARKRLPDASGSVGAGMDERVRSELGMADEGFSFKAATRRLHDQPLSPQRTRALLAYGIQARDGKQLMEDYMNKDIGSEELDATVRRLTTEDPDGMWRIDAAGKTPTKNWDDLMTVNNALVQTLTTHDAPGMMERLNQMEPSRNRIFMADTFSSFWAKQDPAAAAVGFDQVLQLNPSGGAFAEQIVKSWNAKDPSAMAAYIDQLPAGSTRQLFEDARGKLPN